MAEPLRQQSAVGSRQPRASEWTADCVLLTAYVFCAVSVRLVCERVLAEPLHHDLEHLDGEIGVLLQEGAKIPAHQLQAARALLGSDRRGADAFFHESHFAEKLARTHVADPVSVVSDLHPAFGDEKEPHPRLALLDDGRARFIHALFDGPGDKLQFPGRQRAEDWHFLEISQCRSSVRHAYPPEEWGFIRRLAETPFWPGVRPDGLLRLPRKDR